MINRLIEFSVNNKLIIGLLSIAMVVAGIWSMTQVPIDAVPDITNNQVQVITQAPNLGTEDIEQFVTYPVEVAMSNLPGVREIRSVSRFGLSVVTIVFEDDLGTYMPRQLVSEKLIQVKENIPQGFGKPFMGPITTGLGEIYQYTIEVDSAYRHKYSATDLRTIQDWIIRRQMAMVPGVVEVNAFGGNIKQYEVAVNPDKLKAIGLSITDIFKALEDNNQNTGGAYIEKNHQANFIRGEGLARTLKDIENIVVKNMSGIPITIKDVAEVQFGKAIRYGALTKDGKGEAVGGMILMLKGANSDEVIAQVKERIIQIQKSLPEGVRIQPFLDRSSLITKTTHTVASNLIEGGLIVIFILVLLLGNWRGGLIAASTILLSLLFAFILMHIFDVWANLMSLGAIDFGIIVDGAVIIVESTVFLLGQKVSKKQAINQATRDEVTISASKKMMNSAFFGQLIILIVFLPILTLEGVEGKMFKPMALTFGFAMLGAMILCLTYVPMVSSLFIRIKKSGKISWGDRFITWVENRYEPMLKSALKYGAFIIGAGIILFVFAVLTFFRMGGEFIPQLDEGDIAFHTILKPGSSLSESIKTNTKVEQIILDNFPEADHVISRIGVADVPTDPMPMDIADVFIILKPREEWVSADSKEALIEDIKKKISLVPGVNYEFTQPIEMRFNELITGVREDIAIKIFGEDLEVLANKAEEMGRIIASVPGVADMKVEATTGLPQMTVQYDRNKLAQYGLQVNDMNTVVQSAFAGGKAGVIFEGEKRFDLVVRLDSAHRTNIDDLKNMYINLPNGSQVPLKEVANVSYQPGPMQISRDNTNRRVYVGINVRNRDIKSLAEEIQQKLDSQLNLPAGYYIRYGGAFENLDRATDKLKIVVPITLGLIFILIFFALKSIKQTLMIYMAIPLAAIGGVFSLWLRNMPFSISAGVGFIVLFGVAVLNGLVLISGLNELKENGITNLRQRLLQGTRRRIRPILLTALTDVFGFLPMAISTSAGAEVQKPLATVVIGGLITSTLLTLFILPVLYQKMEKSKLKPIPVKKTTALFVLLTSCLLITNSHAQTIQHSNALHDSLPAISMEKALTKAKLNYPQLKTALLKVEKEEVLKKTAWDLGNTQIFTGGEELGNENTGVYTLVGIQQQQIDVFGIAAKGKLHRQKVILSEMAYNLTALDLEQEVKLAWGETYVAKKQYEQARALNSLYREFEKAARLRYETEAISKLEWLAAFNKVKQINIKKDQAYYDYLSALEKLNLWINEDDSYTVGNLPGSLFGQIKINGRGSIEQHPTLLLAEQKTKVADAAWQSSKAEFFPKLNAQYGWQEINGESGFYSFQAGIHIPLSFMTEQGKAQAARIDRKIAGQELLITRLKFNAAYQQAWQRYQKWRHTWTFYQEESLPFAREQRDGAIFSYKEGATDYITFIQYLEEAVQVERDAWQALGKYMEARFRLEYFIQSSIK